MDATNPAINRPSVLSLTIKERAALYAAYMPFVTNGGLFVPTQKTYSLGDEVYVVVTLIDDSNRFPVAGKVVWLSPASQLSTRTQGIGVQFPANDVGNRLKLKIEEILGSALASSRKTHTL